MAETKANQQSTDAATQANVSVVGVAPAMAQGSLYQSLAYAMGLAALNAVYAQQQAFITHQAATVECVARLYSIDLE